MNNWYHSSPEGRGDKVGSLEIYKFRSRWMLKDYDRPKDHQIIFSSGNKRDVEYFCRGYVNAKNYYK